MTAHAGTVSHSQGVGQTRGATVDLVVSQTQSVLMGQRDYSSMLPDGVTVSEYYVTRQTRQGQKNWSQRRVYRVEGTNDPLDVPDVGLKMHQVVVHGGVALIVVERSYEPLDGTALDLVVDLVELTQPGGNGAHDPDADEWSIGMESVQIASVRDLDDIVHYDGDNVGGTSDPTKNIVKLVGTMIGVATDEAGNLTVNGTTVLEPVANYETTYVYHSLSESTIRFWLDVAGHANEDGWNGWNAGEVLYLGPQVSHPAPNSPYRVTHRFQIRRNRTIEVDLKKTGDGGGYVKATVSKKGWQRVDYRVGSRIVAADNKIERGVRSVHVADVYPTTSFATLGIDHDWWQ